MLLWYLCPLPLLCGTQELREHCRKCCLQQQLLPTAEDMTVVSATSFSAGSRRAESHLAGCSGNSSNSDGSSSKRGSNQQRRQVVVEADVIFRVSISSAERTCLLLNAAALLYTPANEHFGIVPLEAMYLGCPVIAVDSGGPRETVRHGETGFLCEQVLSTPRRIRLHDCTTWIFFIPDCVFDT